MDLLFPYKTAEAAMDLEKSHLTRIRMATVIDLQSFDRRPIS